MAAAASVESTVTAELVYLADLSVKPVTHYTQPGLPRREGNFDRFPVRIRNMRGIEGLSLDVHGFELLEQPTAVTDILVADTVESTYYPETAELVKRATGATEAIVFDHTIRTEGGGREASTTMRAPVRLVHNDYTDASGPRRVRDLLSPADAERWLASRVIEVNVWRPVRGPVMVAPLAVCDARSIEPSDLALANLLYPGRIGEIYQGIYNPRHQWYWAPGMTPEEVILLKGYDSATDGRARFTFHSAFDDPATPENPPPRVSIEVRVLATFAGPSS